MPCGGAGEDESGHWKGLPVLDGAHAEVVVCAPVKGGDGLVLVAINLAGALATCTCNNCVGVWACRRAALIKRPEADQRLTASIHLASGVGVGVGQEAGLAYHRARVRHEHLGSLEPKKHGLDVLADDDALPISSVKPAAASPKCGLVDCMRSPGVESRAGR